MTDAPARRIGRQIETLLAYPKVGPLGASAIAINLGTDEPAVRPVLAALVAAGHLTELDDGRYAPGDRTRPGHAGPARDRSN